MVTFDKLPMRDVLVERLGWSEEDARAFLEVLEAPTEHLATQDDIAALRSDLDQVRADLEALRAETAELRTQTAELRTEIAELRTEMAEQRSETARLRSDVERVRADVEGLRRDLNQYREETRASMVEMEQRLIRYIDDKINELDRLAQARHATLLAEFQALLRTHQNRTYLLVTGASGTIIALLIALLART